MKKEKQIGFIAKQIEELRLFMQKKANQKIAEKMISKLYSIPKDNWLEIDHQLNQWQFPMVFIEFMPKWWPTGGLMKPRMQIISPVMKIIQDEFGHKEQLRFH